ncbi:MAG: MmgE/PrpD family protein [Acetobacterales bacterium]
MSAKAATPAASTEITRRLAVFCAGVSLDTLPPEVTARARLLALDTVGIAIRARGESESTPALIAACEKLGLAAGATSVFGDPHGYAAPGAALINGTLCHSLDFDDTHAVAIVHASATVLPAALAAAEIAGADGATVIAGIVAGCETACRLGLALQAGDHYDRGFHPSATCGAFGAAAAAGRVLGLDADGIANAFGIALSDASGSLQFLANGAWTKRYQVGEAARNGLVAAMFAREGFVGAEAPLEGRHGFLNAYAPDPKPKRVVEGLGERFETMNLAIKPYPSCRWGHAAIDTTLRLREEHGIAAEEVEEVTIGVSKSAQILIGDPQEKKRAPKNVVDGQFSGNFVVAVALRDGGMGWDSYAKHLTDTDTLALCRKVTVANDADAQALFPAHMAGKVTIRTKRGTFEGLTQDPKGEPTNFVSDGDVRAKFLGLVEPYLDAGAGESLAARWLALEDERDIAALMAATRRPAAVRQAGE